MSKSLGNGIEPQEVMNSLGADVLRLWIAATDYANEMSLSPEILKRTSDAYRRMRNTVRFLLGNLHDFDPQRDAVPLGAMVGLDRWAIARAQSLQHQVVTAYRDYAFHLIYQKVHNFCVVDLGGFYLDILKDRLYTTPAGGAARRSAQTALWHLAEGIVRWLAPILTFTAEEMWRFLPGSHPASVYLSTWHPFPKTPNDQIDWELLMALRIDVARELERLRIGGVIGAPLDAELDVWCVPEQYERLSVLQAELRFFMITSEARVHRVAEKVAVISSEFAQSPAEVPPDAVPVMGMATGGVWIRVQPSSEPKCVRCWQHRPDVGRSTEHPELCGRCVQNLTLPGESRRYC
jgi:isoleucyl-tRNA synthetase